MIRRPLHRSDANQERIISALRKVGVTVEPIGEPVDIVTYFRGTIRFIEIKADSKKKLTPAQKNFFAKWPAFRVETVEQAMACHGISVD